MNQEVKFCKDCFYYVSSRKTCKAGALRDIVTGEYDEFDCYKTRLNESLCGLSAKCFKEIGYDQLIQKKLDSLIQ